MKWYETDEEFHDQNADTGLVPHGYWSLCLNDDKSAWHLVLLEQNEDLDEIVAEYHEGLHESEDLAKTFAAYAEKLGAI